MNYIKITSIAPLQFEFCKGHEGLSCHGRLATLGAAVMGKTGAWQAGAWQAGAWLGRTACGGNSDADCKD
jgi:hypothetical protein